MGRTSSHRVLAMWLRLVADNTSQGGASCPSAQLPGGAETEETRTATLLTGVNDTLYTSEGRLCGTNNQETWVLVLALAFSHCASLGKFPDLSGHWFPHVKIEAIG